LLRPVPVPVDVDQGTGRPHRFRWKQREHIVRLCAGPERIATGWWREAAARRDYYRIETTDGARFWLYCQFDSRQWFLQGAFE
jgi:protein ImuB